MQIIFELLLALATVSMVGFGVAGWLRKKHSLPVFALAPVVGYALSQLLFFPLYFIVESARLATWVVNGIGLTIAVVYMFSSDWRKTFSAGNVLSLGRWVPIIPAFGLAIFILLVAAFPYLLSGWGNYWHSGNEDFFDALRGRDAYVSGALLGGKDRLDETVNLRDQAQDAYLFNQGILKAARNGAWFESRFTSGFDRFQYSSVAFWSVQLNEYRGLDAFLIQALLNLLLMAQGVYLLGRRIFNMGLRTALCSAAGSVLSVFYLTSYFAGHEGSLIYNSVHPFLLLASLLWIKEGSWNWRWAALITIMLAFLANTYIYPLPYLLLPVGLFALYRFTCVQMGMHRRIIDYFNCTGTSMGGLLRCRRLLMPAFSALLLAGLGAWLFWELFEPTRLRAEMQYRSWGTIKNYIGILQYWGVSPSFSIVGVSSQFAQLIQNPWFIAFAMSLILIWTTYSIHGLTKSKVVFKPFFIIFIGCWLLFFVLMRVFAQDPYYLYKFLYINAFILVLGFMQCAVLLWASERRILRYGALAVVGAWAGVNLANDAISALALKDRQYNKEYEKYREVRAIPSDILSETYVDLPRADHGDVLRYTLTSHALKYQYDKKKAKYLLRMKGQDDVVEQAGVGVELWSNSLFNLMKAAEHNLVQVVAYWEPELTKDIGGHVFNWVSDGRIGNIDIHVVSRNSEGRFLHFCVEPGPSLGGRALALFARDASGKIYGNYKVLGYECYWLDLDRNGPFSQPLTLGSDMVGQIISPIETRRLNWRISRVWVAATVSENIDVREMTPYASKPDITPVSSEKVLFDGAPLSGVEVFLGRGWYPFERFDGETFRWVANDAEIVLSPSTKRVQKLGLELEPGPGLGGQPLQLKVLDDAGQVLTIAEIGFRKKIEINLERDFMAFRKYRLHVDGPGLSLDSDPRILNFRVFHIQPLTDGS